MSLPSTFLRRACRSLHRPNSSLSQPGSSRFSTAAQKPPRKGSFFTLAAAVTLSATAAYTVGSIYPPTTLKILFPRVAPPPLTDTTSPEAVAYLADLETQLQALPPLQALRSQPDAGEWYETRPYAQYPPERAVNNLTAGALRGPGKLALPPIARVRNDEKESAVFLHLGRGLCGHDGIVHGGMLATLLDEALGRNAINNFPELVGVTAKLTLNYRAPTHADQFVVIKTKLDELKGRRALVSGRIEDMTGMVLVEAEALFIQPRYAKMLNTGLLRKAMGEPPASAKEGVPPHQVPVLLADGEKMSSSRK